MLIGWEMLLYLKKRFYEAMEKRMKRKLKDLSLKSSENGKVVERKEKRNELGRKKL
jgi:hypothetical protein